VNVHTLFSPKKNPELHTYFKALAVADTVSKKPTPPRLGDIEELISVLIAAKSRRYASLKKLIEQTGGQYTTRLSQLNRYIAYLNTGRKNDDKLIRVDDFFEVKSHDRETYIFPSALGQDHLAKVQGIEPFFETLKKQSREFTKDEPKRKLRIASSNIIGCHLLPSILAHLPTLPENYGIELEIDSSFELIPRLHLGSFDFIINWGPDHFMIDSNHIPHRYVEPDYDIAFQSLDYETRMILIAHPSLPVWNFKKQDLNRDYYSSLAVKASRAEQSTPLDCKDMKPISLNEIRFGESLKLVSVPSWNLPRDLSTLSQQCRQKSWLIEADTYEKAAAYVAMSQGVAIVPERMRIRRDLSCFRVEPSNNYARPIGVYYNTRYGMKPAGAFLVAYLREFIKKYADILKEAKVPQFCGTKKPAHGEYNAKDVESLTPTDCDWQHIAETEYP
jgi:DNA-binding transcriptional LysR family regulator